MLALLAMVLAETCRAELPAHQPVPGGFAIVPLPVVDDIPPITRFGERRVSVSRQNGRWTALVGLPCDILPGNYILSLTNTAEEHQSVEFGVLPPGSPLAGGVTQTAGERDPAGTARALPEGITYRQVNNPAMRVKMVFDREQLAQTDATFDFDPPVESRELVGYGSLLVQANSGCHDYLSYLTAMGNRVYAPAAGMVVSATDESDVSEPLVIAHGSETLSILGNLGQVLVETGQWLEQGEPVGTAGAAETPTGGRVDWAVVQNGYRVDPLRFATSR
jgi:hypothetical protein